LKVKGQGHDSRDHFIIAVVFGVRYWCGTLARFVTVKLIDYKLLKFLEVGIFLVLCAFGCMYVDATVDLLQ